MQVIDVTIVNKICNGKFYLDKKLIKVRKHILLLLFVQYVDAYLMDVA